MENNTATMIALTHRDMAKILMLYWAQRLRVKGFEESENPLIPFGVKFDATGKCFVEVLGSEKLFPINDCYLELQPLGVDGISDHDAQHINEKFKLGIGNNPDLHFFKTKLINSITRGDVDCGVFPNILIYAVDYLRSCGYALPYKGYSVEQLVEAGIYKFQLV